MLGLARATPTGSEHLAALGRAEPLFQVQHGGWNSQYLEFSPDGRWLVAWVPERVMMVDVAKRAVAGTLEGSAGFVGFAESGEVLLARDGVVQRGRVPSMQVLGPAEEGRGWRSTLPGMVSSTLTGFTVSLDRPEQTVEFPYHARLCPGSGLMACTAGPRVTVRGLDGSPSWDSGQLRRDATSVGFSPDGSMIAFGTMGGSLFVVDPTRTWRHQAFTDGEIRCLAVSPEGLIAVGCADLSSKVWIFSFDRAEPAFLVDATGDTWALAFSPDGQVLATGHETGVIRFWKTYTLPRLRWIATKLSIDDQP